MRRLAALAVLFALAACGNEPPVFTQTFHKLPPTPGGRMCVAECGRAHDYCTQTCGLAYRSCYNDMQTKALQEYDAYTREQFANNRMIAMRESEFEHPKACDAQKKDCLADCEEPYDACYTKCGGTVTTESSCQFLCFE